MARAIVTINGRTSRPAAPREQSLVDRPFLRPMLVRKNEGSGVGRTPVEKAAFVAVDGQYIVVVPSATGEPAKYVGRKNADKFYSFVRYLRPDESVSIVGLSDAEAAARTRR